MDRNRYCIIMAGGVGSRFWPLSRNRKPKQFLDILGVGKTFLQMTFDRFAKIIPKENILVVTSDIYRDMVMSQLPDMKPENILLEPYRRNTAPCIAYATYKLKAVNPDAVMVVAPSDHLILDEEIFLSTVETALDYASSHDMLFTLGITPTRPETGYGYIQCSMGNAMTVNGHTSFKVKTFTEKPDEALAKVFLESGEFLWNSGIFIWNLKTIVSELELRLPDVATFFKAGEGIYYTDREQDFISDVYASCQGISIDYGVMEKTDKAWVFKANFGWSDLGTWDSLYITSDKDENGNMVSADDSLLLGVRDSVVMTTNSNKLLVVKNLSDYMIVDTNDVLMVCPRGNRDFKDLITDLSMADKPDYQ